MRFTTTRRGRAALALLVVAAIAGCETSPSPSPSGPAGTPGPTGPATAGPVATTGPAATTTADTLLPAGAQFNKGVTSIPGESEPVVAQFLTRAYLFATNDGDPEALYREGTAWNHAVIDDGAGYKPP